jgi:hypothetical protein
MLAGFLDLPLPLPTFELIVVVEFAAEAVRYGDEGVRGISFFLEALSSSGTSLRPRPKEESICEK